MPNKIKIKIKDDFAETERFVKRSLEKNRDSLCTVIDAMDIFDQYFYSPHGNDNIRDLLIFLLLL